MTNCCGQQPLLFFCVVVCTPGCCSKPSCVCVQLNVCLIFSKSAALSRYDNLMLCSICVLMLYFLLVALMACYMSKPVFKHFLMDVHASPLWHSCVALVLSQPKNTKVFLKNNLAVSGDGMRWWVYTYLNVSIEICSCTKQLFSGDGWRPHEAFTGMPYALIAGSCSWSQNQRKTGDGSVGKSDTTLDKRGRNVKNLWECLNILSEH